MRAEIISIGTEILLGHIVNTNTAYLSKKMALLGIDVYRHTTVGDNPMRIVSLLKEALSRSDIVFTTGGLGPTVDDITLNAIGSALSRSLVFNKGIEKSIAKHFRKRGLKKAPKDAVKQAYIPRGARWFENKVGTAPAVLVEYGKKLIVALPGPPRELIPLCEKNIIPYLKRKGLAGNWTIKTKAIKTVGLVEAEVNRAVKDLLSMGPETTVGIYAHLGEVDLKITSKAKSEKSANRDIKKVEKTIRKRLGKYIYGTDTETLEYALGTMLEKKKKTLAIAESCTGGLIANRITNISGSSKYFKMGVVAYSNKSKINLLGVSDAKIKKSGAVSGGVALDMAKGIKNLSKSDIAIGITGIAGPKGKAKKKPIGLVYIALISDKVKVVKEYRFKGTREEIKLQSSIAALDLARQHGSK
ncbi:MAG: competence/damage-inducible protein A [Candidatus Omnitrophica bacterium]|nr:competence/damage-inducible protein A [Candidatus Omnitrophota bacterium]